ncbi:hypothetical protein TNCV_3492591 [Trichonephila clavipes]|nr:hypothetical protein TNCV_3492591 [Trichonephila clavipes]
MVITLDCSGSGCRVASPVRNLCLKEQPMPQGNTNLVRNASRGRIMVYRKYDLSFCDIATCIGRTDSLHGDHYCDFP